MSTLDRYKKKGGFSQLLTLIETSDLPKQEKFLKLVSDENSRWEQELKAKMLTIERLCHWPPQFLGEFLPQVPPAQLANALKGMSEENKTLFMNALNFSEKRKVEDALQSAKPTNAEIKTCQTKVILEARNQISKGTLKLDKCDPDLVIPEDIEEQLNSGVAPKVTSSQSPTSKPVSSSTETHSSMDSHQNTPPGASNNVLEELTQLRKKLVQLTQENQKLQTENRTYKDKLDQIKKIA